MALTKYERGSTFHHQITYQSGSTYTDASGNNVTFTLISPEGDTVMSVSGQHRSLGNYDAYMSTNSTATLGIYKVMTSAYFQYRGQYPWGPKIDSDEIQIVDLI